MQLNQNIKQQLQHIIQTYTHLPAILHAIADQGATPYLVGGAVRDLLLGLPLKDLDIEVHGISVNALETILRQFGSVSLVGKVYGVLRVHGLDIDWSIPRADEPGRKPKVHFLAQASVQEAFLRRDLTINAMGINLISYDLVDPFNGYQDLQHGILRATNPARFAEDPLRFYRVMQFLARFAMKPDAQLDDICKDIDLSGVSKERIADEFKKLFLKSKKPSLALDWLDSIGRLKEILPEVAALKGVPQNPSWHPEGDVFEHTKQTIDAAARLPYADDEEKLMMMYAALCHDLGKAATTQENEQGTIISYGHAEKGYTLTRQLLKRIVNDKSLIDNVATLVKYHMHPPQFVKQKARVAAYKRLAHKLGPALSLQQLGMLFLADRLGRNPSKGEPLSGSDEDVQIFMHNAEHAHVLHRPEPPVLHGQDLMPEIKPGPLMGKLLQQAYRIQLNEGIKSKDELKKRILQNDA